MKAKFIRKHYYNYYGVTTVILEYEYREHTYTVEENLSKGNEPLSWQHKNAQSYIDEIIERETKIDGVEPSKIKPTVDEALNELFKFWEA